MESRALTSGLWAAAWVSLFSLILFNSWVCDDAFITFRVVANFVQGYGLRWNISERVQVYTHPLWMLLHIPLYAIFGHIFLVTITLSIACSLGAIFIAWKTFEKPFAITVCSLLLPLALSKTFIDFTTSGLENPLSFLLFALFGYVLVKKNHHPRFWFFLSLTTALALLTRLDTVFLYLPAWLWLAASRYSTLRWRQLAVGFLPLAAWHSFSLFYYGFLFPNTKYAKLNTGIGWTDYAHQGVAYFFEFFAADAFSCMLLCAVFVLLIEQGKRWRQGAAQAPLFFSIAFGIAATMAYVISVGGDFMSGRFWSLPFFATAWLLYAALPAVAPRRLLAAAAMFIALKAVALSIAHDNFGDCSTNATTIQEQGSLQTCLMAGIADEKHFYTPQALLFDGTHFSKDPWEHSANFAMGMRARAHPGQLYVVPITGTSTYYAGPQTSFIDSFALADALLARLPIADTHHWRIGHFIRDIPKGYLEAVKTGDLGEMHPALADYYKPLRLIIRGNLWDSERLKAIVLFNLGYYDHFKEEYLHDTRH